MEKSIKKYTQFVAEQLGNQDIDDHQINEIMKSWGLRFEEEFK